jgi:hypothetical protein
MILYHFTAGTHLRGISKHGLTVGDVPTDIRQNTGRIGVWLTSEPSSAGHGLEGSAADKRRFRLRVDCPRDRLVDWKVWSTTNVTLETRKVLEGANGQSAGTWFVYFGQIPPDCILSVTDMQSETELHDWATIWPEGECSPGIKYEGRFIWQSRLLRDVKRALR